MRWTKAHRFDREVLPLADKHYNRQKPGTPQFAPPGSCLVLKAILDGEVKAFWITSVQKYQKHEWKGAWVCSAFHNAGAGISSELITEAVAATLSHYGEPPALGMITFVDPKKVKHKRDPGRCFLRAKFKKVGITKKSKLLVFQLLPQDMPIAANPI
jgi:hypothetical protein